VYKWLTLFDLFLELGVGEGLFLVIFLDSLASIFISVNSNKLKIRIMLGSEYSLSSFFMVGITKIKSGVKYSSYKNMVLHHPNDDGGPSAGICRSA
jgi:hypothetical protein